MSEPIEQPSQGATALRLHRELAAIWGTGPGLQRLAAVNHSIIGLRMMITSFVFFAIAGVLGMLTRVQLATPNGDFMDPGDLQPGLHHARVDDAVPVCHPDGGELRGLSDPEDSRHARFRLSDGSPPMGTGAICSAARS